MLAKCTTCLSVLSDPSSLWSKTPEAIYGTDDPILSALFLKAGCALEPLEQMSADVRNRWNSPWCELLVCICPACRAPRLFRWLDYKEAPDHGDQD